MGIEKIDIAKICIIIKRPYTRLGRLSTIQDGTTAANKYYRNMVKYYDAEGYNWNTIGL